MGKKIDLTGQKFGRLTAIKIVPNKRKDTYWLCKCDCGNTKEVDTYRLRSGHTRSCGCLEQENREKRKEIDELIGKQYAHLLIIKEIPTSKYEIRKVLCKCECGTEKIISLKDVLNGHTQSCGCYRKKVSAEKMTTHGMSDTRLYKVWRLMIQRCYDKNCSVYSRYGGRGITICDEWLNDFIAFYDWAYSHGYDEKADYMGCTLDRIDVNGNYYPENCRWANAITQCNNRTNNRKITFNGEIHTIAEWARKYNMNYTTLFCRLFKHGWTVEEALTIRPVIGGKR